MIPIIIIGSLAIMVLTIAAIETKTKQEAINCLNKTVFELHERNFELAIKLEEANDKIVDTQIELSEEREKVKNLENTIERNGMMIVQQRKDVVTLSGVVELYDETKPDIFDSDGKLTMLGRHLAQRSVNALISHMYDNPNEFDSFVHVTERMRADDPREFMVVAELNLVKI